MRAHWEELRREPNFEEVLEDPIIQALMEYDGLSQKDFSWFTGAALKEMA